jgi:hypothetical protein
VCIRLTAASDEAKKHMQVGFSFLSIIEQLPDNYKSSFGMPGSDGLFRSLAISADLEGKTAKVYKIMSAKSSTREQEIKCIV